MGEFGTVGPFWVLERTVSCGRYPDAYFIRAAPPNGPRLNPSGSFAGTMAACAHNCAHQWNTASRMKASIVTAMRLERGTCKGICLGCQPQHTRLFTLSSGWLIYRSPHETPGEDNYT